MPDYISRQRLKKIALERWENEGGKISADKARIIKSGSADKNKNRTGIEKSNGKQRETGDRLNENEK